MSIPDDNDREEALQSKLLEREEAAVIYARLAATNYIAAPFLSTSMIQVMAAETDR